MEIDFKEYLTDGDIRDIAKTALLKLFTEQFKSKENLERILSNMAYHVVWGEMDKNVSNELSQKIQEKVIKIVSDDSSYGLFRKADAWGKEDSKAYQYLQQAVIDNKEIINTAVIKNLQKLDDEYLNDLLTNHVSLFIIEKLKS